MIDDASRCFFYAQIAVFYQWVIGESGIPL